MRLTEQIPLQERIFWMKSGPLKGRYVYVWGEGYVEIEKSPAFPDHLSFRDTSLQLGDSDSSFEAVTARVKQSGGLEVTAEDCGTLAFFFNLVPFPDLETSQSQSLKVHPALVVGQLEKMLANIVSRAQLRLETLRTSREDETAQLELKLHELQKALTPQVVHWLYYALDSESKALTVRPLTGTIYEVDEQNLSKPVTQDDFSSMLRSQSAAFIRISKHGFKFAMLEIAESLNGNKDLAFIGSVSKFAARRTAAILGRLGHDESFCDFLDQTLAQIGLDIAVTSNFRKVLYSKSTEFERN